MVVPWKLVGSMCDGRCVVVLFGGTLLVVCMSFLSVVMWQFGGCIVVSVVVIWVVIVGHVFDSSL